MADISDINHENKILIAGPCVVQDLETCLLIASEVKRVSQLFGFIPVFKASFDKANRTSQSGFRSIGQLEALKIINEV